LRIFFTPPRSEQFIVKEDMESPFTEAEPSLEQCRAVLQPYLNDLRTIVLAGWAAWDVLGERAPDLRAPLSARTRANFIYDSITQRARDLFANRPGINIREVRGFLELSFKDQCVVRFKKLDRKYRAKGIPTRQQMRWNFNELAEERLSQMELPFGFPLTAKLIAGYTLDSLAVSVDKVLVTRPGKKAVQWHFEIGEIESNVIVGDFARREHPDTPKVTPKKGVTRKKEEVDE
jgi:hypothetical protein